MLMIFFIIFGVGRKLSAFIGESDSLKYEIAEDPRCDLKLDGKQLELSGLAFPLKKHSDWNQEISKAIHKLTMNEDITKAFKRWTIQSCKEGNNNIDPYRMGFDEFGGFLFNTALCCFGCFGIMGLEIFIYRRISRNRQKFQVKCDSTTLVNSVSMETLAFNTLQIGKTSNRKNSIGKQNVLPVSEKERRNGSQANLLNEI
jgi:hypothetical protein